jgi:hypothetical protein
MGRGTAGAAEVVAGQVVTFKVGACLGPAVLLRAGPLVSPSVRRTLGRRAVALA